MMTEPHAPHWHLHVTVQPHWSWSLHDVAAALKQDIERHEIKPIVITNHFRDPARPPYRELIPTRHHEGDEASASREIFRMGVLLNNSGWRVKRLKIEGDPARVPPGRAVYYETHIRNAPDGLALPRSTTPRSTFHTLRRESHGQLMEYVVRCKWPGEMFSALRFEACVLDTAPELDAEWIGEYA